MLFISKILKTYFYVFIILYSCHVQAQVKGTLNYQLIVDDGATSTPRTINSIVYFTGSKSLELTVPNKNLQEKEIADGDNSIQETKIITSEKPLFIYKNFSKKSLYLSDNIFLTRYLIEDTLANMKWKISSAHQKILNYNCTKATTTFRGRIYEAWFTDDIAIQNGPWKFCGLPGLIVKVSDNRGIYTYELKGINLKAKFDAEIINIPVSYQKAKANSHGNFIAVYNKRQSNNKVLERVASNGTSTGSATNYLKLPKKMELF